MLVLKHDFDEMTFWLMNYKTNLEVTEENNPADFFGGGDGKEEALN